MFQISTGIPTPNCLTENSEKVQKKYQNINKMTQKQQKIHQNSPKMAQNGMTYLGKWSK